MKNNEKKINNITIVNAHWNNRGDEAALLAILRGLKKFYRDSKITILIKDGKSVEQFPELEQVKCFPAKFNAKIWDIWLTTLSSGLFGVNKLLKQTVKTLKNSDLIIYSPGGSVINERFFWRKQMEYLVPFICAKLYTIPMFVAAPSIGPFDTSKKNRILRWLLTTPQKFIVREEISEDYLEQIGIRKNVITTIDSAFYTKIELDYQEKILTSNDALKEFLSSYEKVVGITITDFSWHVKHNKDEKIKTRIEDTFNNFITELDNRGYGILFIPQLFGNQNDYDYMNEFSRTNTFIMDDELDSDFQQYIISKLYAVVGMRYHSNIFSAKMGIPFIAIAYEEKMEGFMQLSDLVKYSISLENLSFENLIKKFNLLERNYQNISKRLRNSLQDFVHRSEKTMTLLGSLLNVK